MATNLIKFCTAALAGSLIGIAYERLSTVSEWPHITKIVSADARDGFSPKERNFFEGGQAVPYKPIPVNAKLAAETYNLVSRFGLPSRDNLRLFNNFLLSYDRRLRGPSWVIEHLSPDKLKSRVATRSKSKFIEDESLHPYFRATHLDFRGSGYDRGHMAPAADFKYDQEAMDQSFTLSNISPQVPDLNQGVWERLESYVRYRASRSKNVYVVTGPLYLPLRASDGNLYVTYRVLGNNHVSVPTHYFKVVLIERKDGQLELEAFLMPNDPEQVKEIKIDKFRVPIDKLDSIERASGVIFFDQVKREQALKPVALPPDFKDGPRPEKLPAH